MKTKGEALDNWKLHLARSASRDTATKNLHIARFGECPVSPRVFVDTWVDGRQRALMSAMGSGVIDNPDFKPRTAAAENFHVDFIGARKAD